MGDLYNLENLKSKNEFSTIFLPSDGNRYKPMSQKFRMLAKESYDEMLKVEEECDVILVEKCFVILGIMPEEQCTSLCALKQLIDLERKVINYVCTKHV